MQKPRVVILGGGTSGWLTAAYLAAKLNQTVDITLTEAADIPTVGVGEATTPSLRATLAEIGLGEYDFMRACKATFKQGIWFANWAKPPEAAPDDGYFHPFERPLRAGGESLAPYWINGLDPYQRSFASAVSIQQAIALHNCAPKRFEEPDYTSPIPYAYHLDAGLLAELLKKVAKQRGVEHRVEKVKGVLNEDNGDIKALAMESGSNLEGDFFIDCSGFSSLLIGGHYQQPFKDYSAELFCDRAVTCQVPHKPDQAIPPYTKSTAMPNGWIWDIALQHRRGVGYVYSSKHTTEAEASSALLRYLNAGPSQVTIRSLEFPVGYRESQWVRNCACVGLSSGFIEPLESTGIHLVEQAAWALAALLPRYFSGLGSGLGSEPGGGPEPQSSFNRIMGRQYQLAIEFVKYHYAISERTDTQFWRDNTRKESRSDWLSAKMELWQSDPPNVYDMEELHAIFDYASYQYVMFGMGLKPDMNNYNRSMEKLAVSVFDRVYRSFDKAVSMLPKHSDILNKIHAGEGRPVTVAEPASFARVNASVVNIPNNYR